MDKKELKHILNTEHKNDFWNMTNKTLGIRTIFDGLKRGAPHEKLPQNIRDDLATYLEWCKSPDCPYSQK